MAVSKVIFNGNTLIDLSSDSVTPEKMINGTTAHDASGRAITGTIVPVIRTVTTAVLRASSWSGESQTVSVAGTTTTNDIFIAPAPESIKLYLECGAYCAAQGNGILTFRCEWEPDEDITVNIQIYS